MHRLFYFLPALLLSVSVWSGPAVHSGSFNAHLPLYEQKLQVDANYFLKHSGIPEADTHLYTSRQQNNGMTSFSAHWPQREEKSTLTTIICTTTPISEHDPLIQEHGLVKIPVFADSSPAGSRHHFYRKDHSAKQGALFLPYIPNLDHRCTSFSTGDGDVAFLSSAENNYDPDCLATCQNRQVVVESLLTVTQSSDPYIVPGVLTLGGGGSKVCCVSCSGKQTNSNNEEEEDEEEDDDNYGDTFDGSDAGEGDGNDGKKPFSNYVKELNASDPQKSDKAVWATLLEALFGGDSQLLEQRLSKAAGIFSKYALSPSSELTSWALQQLPPAQSGLGTELHEQWSSILTLFSHRYGTGLEPVTQLIESLVALLHDQPDLSTTVRSEIMCVNQGTRSGSTGKRSRSGSDSAPIQGSLSDYNENVLKLGPKSKSGSAPKVRVFSFDNDDINNFNEEDGEVTRL